MTDGLPDVPDWIEEKIEVRNDRDVQDHHIIEVFQHAERPFLSVSYVSAEVGMTPEGMRGRLEDLADIGVLNNCVGAGGQVYWINDNRSNWPIPPDVDVEAESHYEDLLSDLMNRTYVQFGVAALGLGLIQGFLITTALAFLVLEIHVPQKVGNYLMGFIILASLFTVLFAILSLVYWGFGRYEGEG